MEDQLIIDRIKKSEESLEAFRQFLADQSNRIEERKAVEFAYLFELFAFSTLHDLMPDYVPSKSTQVQIAQGLGGTRGFITVENKKVKISPEFHSHLKLMQDLNNKKNDNGKLDKTGS